MRDCCHYINSITRHVQRTGIEASSDYGYMMVGRCGITTKLMIIKKKVNLTEDDWLKDLQGDVYRCIYLYSRSLLFFEIIPI